MAYSRAGRPSARRFCRGRGCVASADVTSPHQPPLPGPDEQRDGHAPAPLVAAASVVALEAVLLVLFGLAELRALSVTKATMGITTSLFFAVYGVGLGWFAWQLLRLTSWTVAPVVLTQLIQLGVAWSFRGGATTPVSVVLVVLAVLVLAGVFHPASLKALYPETSPDAEGPG